MNAGGRMTGWTLEEAAMKPVTEVFHIINEQTRRRLKALSRRCSGKGWLSVSPTTRS